MTDQQQPQSQPFRFVLEFDAELTDPEAVKLDQLTTIRSEKGDDLGPWVESDPFVAAKYALMDRATREILTIPGIRIHALPSYMRHPNERGGYDEFVLPEVLSQAEMQQKWDDAEQQQRDEES